MTKLTILSTVAVSLGAGLVVSLPADLAEAIASTPPDALVARIRELLRQRPDAITMELKNADGSTVVAQFSDGWNKFEKEFDKAIIS